ncbi:uncharacterized protein LOC141902225 [Tubulanus polymorphus]|uniref:uncharacterized protein LOC141902225 n=1 Tax=Tubulanus polymorphus TaxID=672921 RepID=UPI003DA1ED2C
MQHGGARVKVSPAIADKTEAIRPQSDSKSSQNSESEKNVRETKTEDDADDSCNRDMTQVVEESTESTNESNSLKKIVIPPNPKSVAKSGEKILKDIPPPRPKRPPVSTHKDGASSPVPARPNSPVPVRPSPPVARKDDVVKKEKKVAGSRNIVGANLLAVMAGGDKKEDDFDENKKEGVANSLKRGGSPGPVRPPRPVSFQPEEPASPTRRRPTRLPSATTTSAEENDEDDEKIKKKAPNIVAGANLLALVTNKKEIERSKPGNAADSSTNIRSERPRSPVPSRLGKPPSPLTKVRSNERLNVERKGKGDVLTEYDGKPTGVDLALVSRSSESVDAVVESSVDRPPVPVLPTRGPPALLTPPKNKPVSRQDAVVSNSEDEASPKLPPRNVPPKRPDKSPVGTLKMEARTKGGSTPPRPPSPKTTPSGSPSQQRAATSDGGSLTPKSSLKRRPALPPPPQPAKNVVAGNTDDPSPQIIIKHAPPPDQSHNHPKHGESASTPRRPPPPRTAPTESNQTSSVATNEETPEMPRPRPVPRTRRTPSGGSSRNSRASAFLDEPVRVNSANVDVFDINLETSNEKQPTPVPRKRSLRTSSVDEQIDNQQTDDKQTDEKQVGNKQVDNKQLVNKQLDNKQMVDKQTDNKLTDNKQMDDKQTDNKQTNDKQTVNKQTANGKNEDVIVVKPTQRDDKVVYADVVLKRKDGSIVKSSQSKEINKRDSPPVFVAPPPPPLEELNDILESEESEEHRVIEKDEDLNAEESSDILESEQSGDNEVVKKGEDLMAESESLEKHEEESTKDDSKTEEVGSESVVVENSDEGRLAGESPELESETNVAADEIIDEPKREDEEKTEDVDDDKGDVKDESAVFNVGGVEYFDADSRGSAAESNVGRAEKYDSTGYLAPLDPDAESAPAPPRDYSYAVDKRFSDIDAAVSRGGDNEYEPFEDVFMKTRSLDRRGNDTSYEAIGSSDRSFISESDSVTNLNALVAEERPPCPPPRNRRASKLEADAKEPEKPKFRPPPPPPPASPKMRRTPVPEIASENIIAEDTYGVKMDHDDFVQRCDEEEDEYIAPGDVRQSHAALDTKVPPRPPRPPAPQPSLSNIISEKADIRDSNYFDMSGSQFHLAMLNSMGESTTSTGAMSTDSQSDDGVWQTDRTSEDDDSIQSSASEEDTYDQPAAAKRPKIYHIAKEIMTSEQVFVGVLKLLNRDFRDAVKSISDEVGRAIVPRVVLDNILKYLPELENFNSELLKDLTERINNWDETPKVADIFVKKGPFLNLYTTYIQDFSQMTGRLDEACKKYPIFQEVVRDFETSEKCSGLALKHYMLKPIQRLPQYKLLLQDYQKHLPVNSLDTEDTKSALEVVTKIASHANESMKVGDNFQKLLEIQNSLIGQFEVVKPGRTLIKKDMLLKLSRKELQERMFFLFNDVLLYTKPVPNGYKLKNVLSLAGMKVKKPTQDDFENEFSIISIQRSFTLSAKPDINEPLILQCSTSEEREQWLTVLTKAIDDNAVKRSTYEIAKTNPQGIVTIDKDFILGAKAPVWVPDARVTMCMACTSEFTVTWRRHHCRSCGRVVCGACSDYRAKLAYLRDKLARVCRECFEKLDVESPRSAETEEKSSPTKSKVRKSLKAFRQTIKSRPAVLKEVHANASESDMSGYLKVFKGKKWKKMWFVVKDKVLYTYKASEDMAAIESMPLLGYEIRTFSEWFENIEPSLVFELSHKGRPSIVFRTESPNAKEKWVHIIQEATVP